VGKYKRSIVRHRCGGEEGKYKGGLWGRKNRVEGCWEG